MKKKLAILLAAFAAFMTGCTEETPEPDYGDFSVSENDIVISNPEEGSMTFDITTQSITMWRVSVTSGQDWLSVSSDEGQGSATVTCNYSENMEIDKRTAELSVEAFYYGERFMTETITVTQLSSEPTLDVTGLPDEGKFIIDAEGENDNTFSLQTNRAWTVSALDADKGSAIDWITFDAESGEASGSITLDVTVNLSGAARTGYIRVTSEDPALDPVDIEVSQEAFDGEVAQGLVIEMTGMSSYIPAGSGTVYMNSSEGTTANYPAEITAEGDKTVLTVTDYVLAGEFSLQYFMSSENVRYELGGYIFTITANQENQMITTPAWNTDFQGFGGDAENPLGLDSADDLALLAEKVNAGNSFAGTYFKLLNDITLSGTWTPIGKNQNNPFSGVFDGGNNTISGLSINDNTGGFFGLFGVAEGSEENYAEIKNVILAGSGSGYDIQINKALAQSACGSILGLAVDYVKVTGCSSSLNMKVKGNSGGIVGSMEPSILPVNPEAGFSNVIIEDCHNSGNIGFNVTNGTDHCHIGGIVAVNRGTVKRCSNSGNLDSDASSQGAVHIGGIVGNNFKAVEECFNSGQINVAKGSSFGGIVGFCSGLSDSHSIENCYNTGSFGDNNNPNTIGGILGDAGANASCNIRVINCYSSGTMNGTSGGVIGRIQSAVKYTVRFCATTHATTVAQGANDYSGDTEMPDLDGTDRLRTITAEQLKNQTTFTTSPWNWDFSTVWTMGSDGPTLRNNPEN